MIVQHTGKECKTKFSIGMEFKNSFIGIKRNMDIRLDFLEKLCYYNHNLISCRPESEPKGSLLFM